MRPVRRASAGKVVLHRVVNPVPHRICVCSSGNGAKATGERKNLCKMAITLLRAADRSSTFTGSLTVEPFDRLPLPPRNAAFRTMRDSLKQGIPLGVRLVLAASRWEIVRSHRRVCSASPARSSISARASQVRNLRERNIPARINTLYRICGRLHNNSGPCSGFTRFNSWGRKRTRIRLHPCMKNPGSFQQGRHGAVLYNAHCGTLRRRWSCPGNMMAIAKHWAAGTSMGKPYKIFRRICRSEPLNLYLAAESPMAKSVLSARSSRRMSFREF